MLMGMENELFRRFPWRMLFVGAPACVLACLMHTWRLFPVGQLPVGGSQKTRHLNRTETKSQSWMLGCSVRFRTLNRQITETPAFFRESCVIFWLYLTCLRDLAKTSDKSQKDERFKKYARFRKNMRSRQKACGSCFIPSEASINPFRVLNK